MFERTRSEGVFFLALMIGSTIGGVAAMAVWADTFAEFTSSISLLNVFVMSVTGALFGFLPFLVIAIPACHALERSVVGVNTRTTILTIGGTGVGALISAITIDVVIHWAAFVGGFSGLALGTLRRHVCQSNARADVLP